MGGMEDANFEDLRHELTLLKAEEQKLSAERERLHHQIDFGFESRTTREREREVSVARRDLQQRIDLLHKVLTMRQVD